jgi:hypothetical protein
MNNQSKAGRGASVGARLDEMIRMFSKHSLKLTSEEQLLNLTLRMILLAVQANHVTQESPVKVMGEWAFARKRETLSRSKR